MSKRKETEEFIVKYIKKISPKSNNGSIYEELFKTMSDKDFDAFINDLETEVKFLVMTIPNFSKNDISVENNLSIAKELNHNFFEKIWIEGKEDMPTYLTPIEYLIVDLPLRRASQMLIKKISVPDDNRVIDAITGQPTGESKGAKISYPELQVASAMGLEKSMIELMKFRGGDIKGNNALNGLISKYGSANQETLMRYESGVESTNTVRTFLTACHLKSTL